MLMDRIPLYIQIIEHFKQLISTGILGEDEKIPAEKELMEQFDVSRITVANALSHLAKEGWIYRIPGRGSFVSSRSRSHNASVLQPAEAKETAEYTVPSTSYGKMIGLVLPVLRDFFAIRLIQGINSVLEGTDYYLTIVLTNNEKQREKVAIQELVRKGAEGLIVFPIEDETYNEEILVLKLRKYPFVLIDRYLPGFETNYVCSDNYLGAQLAVNHLWDLGHRDIVICSDASRTSFTVEERIRGYMEALRQKGSMINPALILSNVSIHDPVKDDKDPLYRHILNRQATAYITLNAKLGVYVSQIARQLGLDVPGDLSVLPYDNPSYGIEGMSEFTHIEQSEEEMGRHSAQILLNLLVNSEKPAPCSKVVLKPSLIVRESTGPAAKPIQLRE